MTEQANHDNTKSSAAMALFIAIPLIASGLLLGSLIIERIKPKPAVVDAVFPVDELIAALQTPNAANLRFVLSELDALNHGEVVVIARRVPELPGVGTNTNNTDMPTRQPLSEEEAEAALNTIRQLRALQQQQQQELDLLLELQRNP